MKNIVFTLIALYRYSGLRPLLRWLTPAPVCRFYPSCSDYAREAIDQHGIFGGAYLTMVRLIKCHPLSEGGIDPVPER